MTDAAELVKLADSIWAGFQQLIAAVQADDPKREILVRIGDLADDFDKLAAQQDGAVTFDDEECYILFLLVDTEARHLRGRNDAINALREKLLPAYRDWHGANPHKVHPHSALVCEQLEQLRRDEQ